MDDKTARVWSLYQEASGLLGGLAEVEAKCGLLKYQLRDERRSGRPPSPELRERVARSAAQMRSDLANYNLRIDEIFEELRGHGVIFDLETMDGVEGG